MAQFKINLKDAINALKVDLAPSEVRKKIPKRVLDEAGKEMIDEIKNLVSKGTSPIRGEGKFAAYRGTYRDRIKKGKIPGKSLKPVNLTLDGDFMDSLEYKILADKTVSIGFYDSLSKKKEQGHREGANGQAQRPIIPLDEETFKKQIMDIYEEKLINFIESKFDLED